MVYIKDLSDGLKSECKPFANGTSLFSVVHDINTSASNLKVARLVNLKLVFTDKFLYNLVVLIK